MIFILAGTAPQAACYVREHTGRLSDYRYVSSAHALRGLADPDYVVVGTFWDRPDAITIWQTLCVSCKVRPVAPAHIEPFLHRTIPFNPIAVEQDPVLVPIVPEKSKKNSRKKVEFHRIPK